MSTIILSRPASQSLKVVPTGLLYIASFIRSRARDIDVRILDLRAEPRSDERFAEDLLSCRPDLVGISGMIFETQEVLELARRVKRIVPSTRVILGGAVSTLDTVHLLDEGSVDFLCIGEGEETLLELAQALQSDKGPDAVKGLVFKCDGKVHYTGQRIPSVDIDDIPFPAYDLIDLSPYFDPRNIRRGAVYTRNTRMLPVFTSRGCPFRCTYCHNIHGKKIRLRKPEKVIEEIKWLVTKYGIDELHICDDCFNLDVERAKRICDMLIENKIDLLVCFVNGIRADRLDEELADKLKAIGTYQLCYGIESAVPRVLRIAKKSLDLDSVRKALRLTTERNILTVGLFMLGFPGETEEEMRETIRFSLKEPMHLVTYSHVIPFPGTEIYKSYRDAGGGMGGHYRDFTTDSGYTDINLSVVPLAKIKRMIRQAYARFFLNPVRLWNIFRLAPDKMQFLTHSPLRFVVRVFPFSPGLGRRLVDRFLYDKDAVKSGRAQ
jgi:radical SAM superfamily enzyme YgiQ (UPF0313 family)